MTRHSVSTLSSLALLASVAACSAVGGAGALESPGPSVTYPEVSGAWMGALQIEGQGYHSMLDIAQADGVLRVQVQIPMIELSTVGTGSVYPDGTLRVSFRYELECPGDAEFVGEVTESGSVLEGRLLASDCTGDLRGTFRFTR